MKIYIVKLFIALIFVYIAFEITIGPKLNIIGSNINKLNDINYRNQIKDKLIDEIEQSSTKENYFNERERVVISNFINKIIRELDLKK